MTRTVRIVAATCALGLVAAAPARAEFGAPQLLTVSSLEQSDGVSSSALSADGRYLVFAGSLDGISGVLRRDLATGVIEPVAAGDAYGGAAVATSSAPSVSANGRYVSFTTTAALDPDDDTNDGSDVYVRDMDETVPSGGAPCTSGGPCAYTLVSARDGSTVGLSYAPGAGASAIPRQAISADGRRVAFLTGASDLAGPNTPGGQVAVRDLDTRRTTLVSVTRDAATGASTGQPVPGGAVSGPGAAISADGTTVVWSGTNVGLQAATVVRDPATTTEPYNEPLWRRVADGPSAPTRRVAPAGDPDAPGCPAGGTIDDPPCQGPYPDLGGNAKSEAGLQGGWLSRGGGMPSVSADGRTVAFLGAPPLGARFGPADNADLFVADMHDGVPRRAALQRLTFDPQGSRLTDLAIAPNGRRIAFATDRIAFALSPPYLIGAPPPRPGLQELWLVDFDGQTLQRLSRTVDGGPTAGPTVAAPVSPSFGAGGTMVAFDSPASNLVAVDRNGTDDAFLVQDRPVPKGAPGRVDIGAPPLTPQVPRVWRMAVRAVAQRDGTVRLDATLPGTGTLRATVQATVPVRKTVKVKRRGGGRRTVRRTVLAKRRIALASTSVGAAGLTRLTVRVTKAYRALLKTKAGLDATAQILFAARPGAPLSDTVAMRFRVVKPKTKAKPKTTKVATHR